MKLSPTLYIVVLLLLLAGGGYLYGLYGDMAALRTERDAAREAIGTWKTAAITTNSTLATLRATARADDASLNLWAGGVEGINADNTTFIYAIKGATHESTPGTARPADYIPRTYNDALCMRYTAALAAARAGGNGGAGHPAGGGTAGAPHTPAAGCAGVEQLTVEQLAAWAGLLITHASLEGADKGVVRGWAERVEARP